MFIHLIFYNSVLKNNFTFYLIFITHLLLRLSQCFPVFFHGSTQELKKNMQWLIVFGGRIHKNIQIQDRRKDTYEM